ENSLEHFGVQTITLAGRGPTGGGGGDNAQARDPVVAGYFDMTVTRDQVRQDRDALQRALARGDSGLTQSALDVIGSVQKSPELAQALDELTKKEADLRAMRYRYSEEYPPLQRLVGDIAALRRQTIPTLVRSLVQELAAREGELSGRITTSSNDLRRIPPRAIEEARLRRAVTIAENLYTNVESRYQEARLAESSAIPDVKILDAAVVPRAPLQDLARRFVLVGFCAGLGLAVAGALLFDRMDPRVRYPEQVSRELGLPILGTVPHLARLRDVRKGVARGDKATDNALASLRGIRLNLSRAYGAAGPLVFGITSPGAGDGKSFLSANLALSFAAAGYPTLIVDADMRRGQLHKHLNARRRPGLAEYLR